MPSTTATPVSPSFNFFSDQDLANNRSYSQFSPPQNENVEEMEMYELSPKDGELDEDGYLKSLKTPSHNGVGKPPVDNQHGYLVLEISN